MKTVYTVTNKVKIQNVNGTAGRKCECGSWLEHWENFSDEVAILCAVHGCHNRAEVGAHVTRPLAKMKHYKSHPYIVPMCKSHNGNHGDEFNVKENTTFVWANVDETCGK